MSDADYYNEMERAELVEDAIYSGELGCVTSTKAAKLLERIRVGHVTQDSAEGLDRALRRELNRQREADAALADSYYSVIFAADAITRAIRATKEPE